MKNYAEEKKKKDAEEKKKDAEEKRKKDAEEKKKDAVEKMDSLGVSLLILTYILFAIFIDQVVLNILDIKLKKNALFSLIGNGIFFAIYLAYLIFALAINVNTIFTSSSINAFATP